MGGIMKRITAIVTAASASGALAIAAVSAGMLPASASTAAATRPAAHVTAHAKGTVKRQIARDPKVAARGAAKAAKTAKAAKAGSPVQILSQYRNGEYVSVVHCQGGQVPPPLQIQQPGVPLHLAGQQPSASVVRSLGHYKPVYRCTLVIEKRPSLPGKGGGIRPCEHARPSMRGRCHVTLNTGFGGAAASVKGHRPRS